MAETKGSEIQRFDLSEAQQKALIAICDADGGTVDRHGRMVMRGEVSRHDASTWLLLAAKSLIVGDIHSRLIPSNSGLAIVGDLRRMSSKTERNFG